MLSLAQAPSSSKIFLMVSLRPAIPQKSSAKSPPLIAKNGCPSLKNTAKKLSRNKNNPSPAATTVPVGAFGELWCQCGHFLSTPLGAGALPKEDQILSTIISQPSTEFKL